MTALQSDHTKALLRKRLWTPADLGEWLGISSRAARSLLKRLHVESGGMLIMMSKGRKPEYTFFAATLAKVKPEIFERIESLEVRIVALEDAFDDLRTRETKIVSQVGQNSRDIARMRRRPRAA